MSTEAESTSDPGRPTASVPDEALVSERFRNYVNHSNRLNLRDDLLPAIPRLRPLLKEIQKLDDERKAIDHAQDVAGRRSARAIHRNRQLEADHRAAVTAALEAGEDPPPPPALEPESTGVGMNFWSRKHESVDLASEHLAREWAPVIAEALTEPVEAAEARVARAQQELQAAEAARRPLVEMRDEYRRYLGEDVGDPEPEEVRVHHRHGGAPRSARETQELFDRSREDEARRRRTRRR